MRRAGFTLVEVAIGTLVLVVAGLVVLMLLPGALRAQQASRYQMLAATHAQSMMASFYQHEVDLVNVQAQFTKKIQDLDDRLPTASDLRNLYFRQRMLGDMGQYDLERVVGNRVHGNYPVPLPIARRLDSSGDAIRRILDGGGYIYYTDPLSGGRQDDKMREFGDHQTARGDMQRLVWSVVGYAQHGVLPYDPVAIPHQEVYPFPPISRSAPIDRVYKGSFQITWEKEGEPRRLNPGDVFNGVVVGEPKPGEELPTVQRYRQVVDSTDFLVHDAYLQRNRHLHLPDRDPQSFYQNNNWEWYAHSEPDSPWEVGLAAYRRLVNDHWLRIVHQILPIEITGQGGSVTVTTVNVPVKHTAYEVETTAGGTVKYDEYGRPYKRPVLVDGTATLQKDAEGNLIESTGSSDGGSGYDKYRHVPRGWPSPANGLGIGGLQGSDLLWEDAVAHREDLAGQLRVSLPSLERRIMYRTAALALWAQVYRGIDIIGGGDPNVADDLDLLDDRDNPLSDGFVVPDPASLHPTQVLAASYLAHAAVMVTGYRPPFYHNHNTLSSHDDELLMPDGDHPEFNVAYEQLPYRPVEASWLVDRLGTPVGMRLDVALRDGGLAEVTVDPTTGEADFSAILGQLPDDWLNANGRLVDHDGSESDRIVVIDPQRHVYLWNPYHPNVMGTMNDDAQAKFPYGDIELANNLDLHVHDSPLNSADPQRYQLYDNGRPIGCRRMTGGVISPFPPPYADRGAFDQAGQALYEVRWQLAKGDLVAAVDAAGAPVLDADGNQVQRPSWRLLRKVSGYTGAVDQDTRWARNAHGNCLTMAMGWVSGNPYDLTVPKPANRMTFIDRGIYQFDLFDAAGRARRPAAISPQTARFDASYTVTFPVDAARDDRARFGAQTAFAETIDTPFEYWNRAISGGWRGHEISTDFPPHHGRPFQFGAVHSGLPGDREKDHWRYQRGWQAWVNASHGHAGGAATLKANQDQAARPERCTATAAFTAEERTRQLVYWLVDWQAYEDAESAPSAPVDYGQLSREQLAPFVWGAIQSVDTRSWQTWDLQVFFRSDEHYGRWGYQVGDTLTVGLPDGTEVETRIESFTDSWYLIVLDGRPLNELEAMRDQQAWFKADGRGNSDAANDARFLRGNPEINFTWMDPEHTATRWQWERTVASKSMSDGQIGGEGRIAYYASGHPAIPLSDIYYKRQHIGTERGIEQNAIHALGAFGADRNGNGTFDQGPIPGTTRMQASEIARFNFYDPLCWIGLGR